MNTKIRHIAVAAVAGALYLALTVAFLPFSYGPVQVRLSEALCVLPFFAPGTAWGLFAGCAIANAFGGFGLVDVIFGSLATLASGLIAGRLRSIWLVPLPAVIINAIVVGVELTWLLTDPPLWATLPFNAGAVALGQVIACYGFGIPLMFGLRKTRVLEGLRGG